MKNTIALSLMLVGSNAFASLDGHLVEYSNGHEVMKAELGHALLKEDAMMLGDALTTLESLSTDQDNRECQILTIHRLDDSAFEIVTRTNGTVQVMKVVSAETRLVDAIHAAGEISRAPIGPLESNMVEPVGKSFKMIRLRTLALHSPNGMVGVGDLYNVLQIYFADTEMGPKILKIETQAFSSKQSLPMVNPRLQQLGDVSGTCEPHRASTNMHMHPVYK